jgi:hypothetical protein
MQLYYYLFLSIAFLIVVLFARYFIVKKNNVPVRLFTQALRNENSGDLEEAIITYETALAEVKKIRFQSDLKKKIIQKLKVLHTMIEYKKNCHFIR